VKILRLDLLAFGPFTDLTLSLDGGRHGLHLVHGPNEAGKSSTLRALRQWLYGVPHNSADNFLHSHQKLRIGGLLENAAGQRLEFVRRKGRSNTLRGPDDAQLVEQNQLDAMLGGVDENAFAQRFGIDYAELRKGGAAIVRGGGELADTLFAAGAGIADVRQVQTRIEAEMQDLFKPGGSNPRINDALKRWKQTRDELKDAQLPTADWSRFDKQLRDDDRRQQEIDAQLRDKRAEKSRLERIDQALPRIGRRKQLSEQLAEVADAPLLPDDFAQQRSTAAAELANAQRSLRGSLQQIERISQAITAQTVPTGLLEHRSTITGLHATLGGYRKAAKDRPTLAAELESKEQQTRAILQELGREPELDQAERFRLTRVQRQRIQALAGDCKALMEKQSSAEQTARKLQDQLERLERQWAELPADQDPAELQRAIRRARKHGDIDQQLAETRAAVRQLVKRAEIDLNKLRLFHGTLEQLETLPVPALETVDRFESGLSDAERAVQRIGEQISQWTEQLETADRELEKLRLEHDVPSEADLVDARQRRDAGWQLVREALRDGQPVDASAVEAFVAAHAVGGDLAQAFQASLEAADAVADRLRRDADQVSKKAMLTAQRQDFDRRIDAQHPPRAAAQAAWQQLQSEWCQLWTGLGIEPLTPREMRTWLAQQQTLTQAAESIRQQRSAAEQSSQLVQSARDDLNRCLAELGQTLPATAATLADALDVSEEVASTIERANQQRQKLADHSQQLRTQLADAHQTAAQADRDLDGWRKDWAESVSALGLDQDTAPSAANSVLEAVDTMRALLKDAAGLRSRIQGIDDDAQSYHAEVRELLARVAPDLLERSVEQAVADLYDRLEIAGRSQATRDEWQKQLKEEEGKRDKAEATSSSSKRSCSDLCLQAGCDSVEDLPAAEQRSRQLRDCQRELQAVESQLAELAAGAPLDRFIAEAEPYDPDALRADVQQLADAIEQLDQERTTVAERIGSSRSELRRMDGSGRAAEANEQSEQLMARLRSDVEQYVRLRLAAGVLRRAIDRFRQSSQGPVLARASSLFADLTRGSFAGLRPDFDDKGHAVLVGVRPGDGHSVGVEGMSDGTCDQLYLALRLALLETYLDGREPLPFIVDDILIMFDDARAAAALQALARLSEKTQVIFFTHHDHLVRLASETIPPQTLHIHTLTPRATDQ
jgi:uncharacterized protein YhaN